MSKEQAVQLHEAGKSVPEISKITGHSRSHVYRILKDRRAANGDHTYLRKVAKSAKSKAKTYSDKMQPMSYLAKQLEAIGAMICAKLPELARFNLTTTTDGVTHIEYTVRSEVSGRVKL